MNNNCEIIHDLIPLYIDNVCSDSGKHLVEEHLTKCTDCQKIMQKMKNSEVESELMDETTEILGKQAKYYKRKSFVVGAVISGIFCIPILTCFIVNLASGAGLDWFFIVLTSLMLAASIIVVPLMVEKNKFIWTAGLSTVSLMLLLGTCCIYTGGNWFFVAASSTLFGLAVCLMPFVVNHRLVKPYVGKQKSLICIAVDSILFWAMMLSIGFQSAFISEYRRLTIAVGVPIFLFIWFIFIILRYLGCSRVTRAGMSVISVGVFCFIANKLINGLLGVDEKLPKLNIYEWNEKTLDGNIKWIVLLSCLAIGVILIAVGIVKDRKKD